MSYHVRIENFPSNISFYIYFCSLVQFVFGSSNSLYQQEVVASGLLLPLLAPFQASQEVL